MFHKINYWLWRKMVRKDTKEVAKWARDEYDKNKQKDPSVSDEEIYAMMFLNIVSPHERHEEYDRFVSEFCVCIHAPCYFQGLNSPIVKDLSVFRCLEYVVYMDDALQQQGFSQPSPEQQRKVLTKVGIPSQAISELVDLQDRIHGY